MTAGTTTADETQPLLRSVSESPSHIATNTPLSQDDAATTALVGFDPRGDPDNPLEWPARFKWVIVGMLTMMSFTVTLTCISVVPLASDIVRDLSGDGDGNSGSSPSRPASVLLVTIWELGEAAGPLVMAPLSEALGRYAVLNGANAVFVAATALAARSSSVGQLVAARVLTGLAVATNVLGPAVVGDIFPRERRGAALSLLYLASLAGGAVAPLVGSAGAHALGWRRVVALTAALAAACELLFLTCFRETYSVAILRRRRQAANKAAGCAAPSSSKTVPVCDDEGPRAPLPETAVRASSSSLSELAKLRDAVLRPAVVLCGSGVLLALSLFGSVAFAFFYVMSTTLSDILVDIYGLSPVAVGLCYTANSIGSAISVVVCNRTLDRIYVRMRDAHDGVGRPEFRLPLSVVGAFALPLAVAAYGWCAALRLPLVFLLSAVCLMGMALMLAMLPVMAYVVDAFGLYAASALTGVIVTRCLMGTFLPLTTAPLVARFGHGWGFTALAGLSLLLAPIPALLLRYGARWRRFSKYTRDV